MLRKRDEVSFKDFEKLGFKYGTRDKFIFKTTKKGLEASIFIDLLPCHNNNNEIYIYCQSNSLPKKIVKVLYELINRNLVEWED